MSRRARHSLIILAAVLVLAATSWMLREPLLVGAARALTVDDAIAPADYLVVLTGAPESRPFRAAELYHRRFAPEVLLFESAPRPPSLVHVLPKQSDLYRRVLELSGVPPTAVRALPGPVRNTWEEALVVDRFLTAHPARRVIVVTSSEHTRRARWAFRTVLQGTGVDVRMAAARDPDFDESNWWRDDNGVLSYLHEYVKLPFYRVRYLLHSRVAAPVTAAPQAESGEEP